MPSQPRQEGSKSQERLAPAQGRPRSEPQARQTQEPRRRRGDQRAAFWGDGVDRAWCTKALILLPETFPVESHAGVATITPTIVDRREQMILLCNFSHGGEHEWPAIEYLISGGDSAPDE